MHTEVAVKRLMITALLALFALTGQAQEEDPAQAGGTYRVSLEVTRGGKFLGAPFLIMTEGARQSITLRDGATTIQLEPLLAAGTSSASVDTVVTIANGTWRPVVGVPYGGQRSFAVEQLSVLVKVVPIGDNAT